MKKILLPLLTLFLTTTLLAQESVLLRMNYEKGDKFLSTIEQSQTTGTFGGTTIKMTMTMDITEVSEESLVSNSQIKSIKMDMLQNGVTMSYDSAQKEEELDATGKMMKTQFEPLLKSTIITTIEHSGKTVSTKIEPSNPMLDQFSNQSNNIVYPTEAVSVGYSWSREDESQGMKTKTIYTVSKIANGTVYLNISGSVTGLGEGTIKGSSEIDIETGLAKKVVTEISVSSFGIKINVSSNTITKKI